MANPKLTVEIDADISRMEKGLNESEKALKGIEKEISRVSNEIKEATIISRGYGKAQSELAAEFKAGAISQTQYRKSLQRLQRDEKESNVVIKNLRGELRSLNAAQRDLGGSSRRLGKNVGANATPALQEFSRVVQDAPYGIMGVGNNIQQLTAQFGYLQKSAGGTIPALKAMAASLMGPGGILFAVSVVTTLLTVFSDEIFKSGEEAKTAEEKLNDYVDALNAIERARLKGATSAAKELTNLKLLSQQATNTALAMKEREAAVKELRNLYPTYLKNMTDEQILADGLSTAYNEVANSIMRKARAQAASNIITENLEKEFKVTNQLASKRQELEKATERQTKADEKYNKAIERGARSEIVDNYFAAAERAKTEVNELKKEVNELTGVIQSGQLENINLRESVKASGDLIVTPEDVKVEKPKDAVRIPITPILDLSQLQRGFEDASSMEMFQGETGFKKMIEDDIALMKMAQSAFSEFSNEYRMIGEQIKIAEDRASGFGNSLVESGKAASEELKRIGEGLTAFSESQQNALLAQQEAFAERQKMIAGLVGNAFAQVSNQMVDLALEGKLSFDDLAKSVLKAVSSILTTLAAQAIGNAIVGATQASTAAGPAAPLVLPGLLVGMTGLVKNAFPAFQDGGIVGGNSLYGDKILARVNSQELILNRQQQAAVWGQMNTGASMGMSAPIEIVGQTLIEGENLRVILERNNRNRSRQT